MTELEKQAKEFATKISQTYKGFEKVGEPREVIDPDMYDAYLAGARMMREKIAQKFRHDAEMTKQLNAIAEVGDGLTMVPPRAMEVIGTLLSVAEEAEKIGEAEVKDD